MAWGKIFRYFVTIMDRETPPTSPTFSLRLEFLNEAEKEKNNGKGDMVSAQSRFASLFEGEMQQILTERLPGKTKQMTNWSVSAFKGKLKFFCFKIVKYKT